MEAKGYAHVFDAANYKRHARQITRKDGTRGIEKRPITKSIRCIDPSGNEAWLPLYSGPAQSAEVDPYRVSIMHAKRKKGWLPYDECPQLAGYATQQLLPDAVRGRKPCTVGANGQPISESNPCQCLVDTSKVRLAETAEINRRRNEVRTTDERNLEVQQALLEETRRQNQLLAQRSPAPRKDIEK